MSIQDLEYKYFLFILICKSLTFRIKHFFLSNVYKLDPQRNVTCLVYKFDLMKNVTCLVDKFGLQRNVTVLVCGLVQYATYGQVSNTANKSG